MTLSIDDLERAFLLQSTGLTEPVDLSTLERAFYAAGSGLTPAEQYSLADHQREYEVANYDAVVGDLGKVIAKNLHTNPSVDAAIAGGVWQAWGGTGGTTAITRETSGGHSGANFARATWSVSASAGGDIAAYVPSAVWEEGDVVRGSIWMRCSVSRSFYATLQFHDVSGIPVGNGVAGATVAVTANTWTQLSIGESTVIAGSVKGKIRVVPATGGMNAGEILDADDVVITLNNDQYDVTDFFQGDTSNSTRWTGTANASASELIDPRQNTSGELMMARFRRLSSLSPKADYSYAEHEMQYYKDQLGL